MHDNQPIITTKIHKNAHSNTTMAEKNNTALCNYKQKQNML